VCELNDRRQIEKYEEQEKEREKRETEKQRHREKKSVDGMMASNVSE
jgi:hypothetical protein